MDNARAGASASPADVPGGPFELHQSHIFFELSNSTDVPPREQVPAFLRFVLAFPRNSSLYNGQAIFYNSVVERCNREALQSKDSQAVYSDCVSTYSSPTFPVP